MSLGVELPVYIWCRVGECEGRVQVGRDIEFTAGCDEFHRLAILGNESPTFCIQGPTKSRFTLRFRGKVPIKNAYPNLTVAAPQYAKVGDVARCCIRAMFLNREVIEIDTAVVFDDFNPGTGELTAKEIRVPQSLFSLTTVIDSRESPSPIIA